VGETSSFTRLMVGILLPLTIDAGRLRVDGENGMVVGEGESDGEREGNGELAPPVRSMNTVKKKKGKF